MCGFPDGSGKSRKRVPLLSFEVEGYSRPFALCCFHMPRTISYIGSRYPMELFSKSGVLVLEHQCEDWAEWTGA